MAGRHKDDDWSDSEDDAPPKPSGKGGQASVSGSVGKGKGKGPTQLEFLNISEIQKVISVNEVLSDAAGELLESLAQCISRYCTTI